MNEENVKESYKIIYELDCMFTGGRFSEVNSLLRSLDLSVITPAQLISYLAVTKAVRDNLPYRSDFYKSAEEELRNRGKDFKLLLSWLE